MGRFAENNGAIGADGRFAIFETTEDGFAALTSLLSSAKYQALTLDQAIARYAPPNENDTGQYQAMVSDAVGVTGDTRLSVLTSGQMAAFVQGVARVEGFFSQGTVSVTTINRYILGR